MFAGPIIFGPAGPMVIDGQFGFDPWEDLHKNLKQNLEKALQDGSGPGPRGHGMMFGLGGNEEQALVAPGSLEASLGSLMQVFGDDHAGHFGRAEGSFDVNDDQENGLRISATLPGYKLGGADLGSSPLTVKVVGRRSLVVTGTQQDGMVIEQWQRSFMLPKGSDTESVSVTYNSSDGNLTVVVPRGSGNSTALTSSQEEDEEDQGIFLQDDDMDSFLPPALRAMQQGLPQIFEQLQQQPGQGRGKGRLRGGGGFLMPLDGPPMFDEVFGMMDRMHPRFQQPPGGEREVPDEAEVNLVGCFSEEQLAKADLKYYGETNAASFAAMYWHAQADRVPYFAMSRHEEPLGHAFTFRNFTHEKEDPQWGLYDGCGSRCEDDETRWCGCANEASRGLFNRECGPDGEKRFAVYKAAQAVDVAVNESESETASADSAPQSPAGHERRADPRPYWQLSNSDEGDSPTIEIVAPKGTVAKASGRQVVLFNATTGQEVAGRSEGAAEGEDGKAEEASEASSSQSEEGASAVLGKFRLPVDVAPEQCEMEADGSKGADGGQVLKCRLEQDAVKVLPIKVVDEL